jgi:streptogramin lyase
MDWSPFLGYITMDSVSSFSIAPTGWRNAMKPKSGLLLLISAVLVAACNSPPVTHGSATREPISQRVGIITEFPLPMPELVPAGITAGPDGALWLLASTLTGDSSKVGRMTPTGQLTWFALPFGIPVEIVTGPDGNLWITAPASVGINKVERITPTGQLTAFPLALISGYPDSIAAGPDGNLWLTENPGHQIGRMTPTGQFTEFSLPNPKSVPNEITAGPDGNLWFTEDVDRGGQVIDGQIGRATPTGQFTEFPLPTPGTTPAGITTGPDGALWFTECLSSAGRDCTMSQIGRMTPTGQFTFFALPTPRSISGAITTGPDGNLWFTECSIPARGGAGCTNSRIGRMTPAGQLTEYALPNPSHTPYRITTGPDGNLWFAEEHPSAIGHITSGKGG